jgi:uncharacterized protein
MAISHVPTWEIAESSGYETAWIDLGANTLRARGRAVGTAPEPYRIGYELETGPGFVTRRLRVTAETAGGSRELDLRRDGDGGWTADGAPVGGVEGALDCDLGCARSPTPCRCSGTAPISPRASGSS